MGDFFVTNQNYFIETCTKYFTGTVIKVGHNSIVLSNAAWIPATGRYNESLKSGQFAEVEPIKENVLISFNSIVSAQAWPHPLPTEVK